MLTVTDIITFERVGLKTIDHLVRWQIRQFQDFERWLANDDDWETLMNRFQERLEIMERVNPSCE